MLIPSWIRQLRHLPRLLIRQTTSGPLGPALRAFLLSFLLWLLAFLYCRGRFWRDPHSAFFRSENVYDLGYSALRRGEAGSFLLNATYSRGAGTKAGSEPIVCAGFVTVKRENRDYFGEAIGSMLAGLSREEREALYVYVLFADTEPARHPSWGSIWMNGSLDEWGSYEISEEEMERIRKAERERNFYVKGVFDYTYTLKKCMNTTAPYIAIFEDDIIFADGWLTRLLTILPQLTQLTSNKTTTTTTISPPPRSILPDAHIKRPWLYLRLFYTETSLMWQDTDFWYANMPLAFFLTSLSTLSILLLLRWRIPGSKPHLDNFTLVILSLVSVPAFLALLYMIGPYSLHPLHGLIKTNKYGCCTQGLVFPRTQVPSLLEFFRERVHGQTDSMIEEYADREGLDRFALAPQVVQHVGLVSSRDNVEINSRSTWAFWFEENRGEVLGREHERGVGGIAWEELRKGGG